MDSEDLKLLKDVALIDQQLEIGTLDCEFEESADEKEEPPSQVDAQTSKDLNLSCQNLLKEIEAELLKTLKENQEKQKLILNYLNDSNKKCENIDDSNMCTLIRCAGIPYFKDFHGYPQPSNEDVKDKLAHGELLCTDYLKNSCIWSKHDKECLTKAVLNNCKDKTNSSEKSVDWLKISATDMNGKYSPSECQSQWKLHLSPSVNKKKWSRNEIAKLNLLAKKFQYQDWDNIAIELGTDRSGYQCCIQYQKKNSLNDGKWTSEEDAHLKTLVERFKKNDYIPWTKISWFFQTRSRKQCQDRYLEHLRVDLKKGLFSPAEDKIIISGVKIFKDFGKLAKFLPGRASTQIRSRYYYLIGAKMSEFTEEEDELLLSLVKKHPKDWLAISQNFPNRSKLQCRKRFAALCREKDVEHKFWQEVRNCKKVMGTEKAMKMVQMENPGPKRKLKNERHRIAYNEIITFHENCSENYYGPRLRNPTTEIDLKMGSLKLMVTMAMLSVPCDFSGKNKIIESLKDNCNFDFYDIKLLQKLAEEDGPNGSKLQGMLIPPNRATLTGYHTITSSLRRIQLDTCEAEGFPLTSTTENVENGDCCERLSFSRAKALFKERLVSMFLLPSIVSRIPSAGLSQEIYHKPKNKKPKKMTKKRLRNHAKEMNAAYREKRRKLEEGAGSVGEETFPNVDKTKEIEGSTSMEDDEEEALSDWEEYS